MQRLKQVAPFLLIGPISGPLLAGAVINYREGRPVLGSMYSIAFVQYLFLLPALTAKLGVNLF
ncbi:MAG: hypothetical protein ACK4YQ_14890 [Phenylobacterium sp.]|uniref:hypothetical protein n=1 Tax=Phenylobacterium sp. TaxID=1871053 RepID=UPI003918B159